MLKKSRCASNAVQFGDSTAALTDVIPLKLTPTRFFYVLIQNKHVICNLQTVKIWFLNFLFRNLAVTVCGVTSHIVMHFTTAMAGSSFRFSFAQPVYFLTRKSPLVIGLETWTVVSDKKWTQDTILVLFILYPSRIIIYNIKLKQLKLRNTQRPKEPVKIMLHRIF